MDYYGPRDHGALPSMLAHLYARRGSLLRPGLSLALQPNGKIYGIVSGPGHGARDFYELCKGGIPSDIVSTAPLSEGSASDPEIFAPDSGHLPFGFRSAQSMSPSHAIVLPPWPGSSSDHAPPPSSFGRIPDMRPAKFSAPRHGFDQYGSGTFLEGAVMPVMSHELDLCSAEFSRFCFYAKEYVHAGGQSLDGLCRFVEGLNGNYAPSMRLDTVFVGMDIFSELIAADAQGTPVEVTRGVAEYGGLRVLGHACLPDNAMYVMSHTHGPIFVNGPTTLTCTEDEFIVGRYCQIVSPQGGLSGRTPYGLRLDVVGS